MRTILRRFKIVGAISTISDIALFMAVVLAGDVSPWIGDAIAVTIATVISWTLHGAVTFPDDPSRRWYRSMVAYLATAFGALALSVTSIVLLSRMLPNDRWYWLLAIKLAAIFFAFQFRVSRYRNTMFAAIRAEQGQPVPRQAAAGQFRLTVVLPAFNEADRIATAIGDVRESLGPIRDTEGLEIVVVDDGSSDATSEVAQAAGADQVIRHQLNRGKGAAVRSGVLAAQGRTVAFTDADLSYPPSQLVDLLNAVEQGWDVVVGSRQHIDTRTVVRAGRVRELGGRLINLLSAYVLLGRYRDTQCGIKAFRSDAAKAIFSHTRIDGFAFDIEVFALIERYRLALLEVPVTIENSERSTVRVARDAFRLIADLFRIRRFTREGVYETDANDDTQRYEAASRSRP